MDAANYNNIGYSRSDECYGHDTARERRQRRGGLAVLRARSTPGSLQGKMQLSKAWKGDGARKPDGVEGRTSQDVCALHGLNAAGEEQSLSKDEPYGSPRSAGHWAERKERPVAWGQESERSQCLGVGVARQARGSDDCSLCGWWRQCSAEFCVQGASVLFKGRS